MTAEAWALSDSDGFVIRSEAVGDDFAIGVAHPPPVTPVPGVPDSPPHIVYVLDGSLLLGAAAGISRALRFDAIRPTFPALLLVGIDYPSGAVNRRSRDFTMPDSVWPAMATALEQVPGMEPGGAEAFLRFLEDELDPQIRSRYEVSDGPAGILGDSFGGTFTFYAFLKQSRLFDRYWLGSPGVFTTGTDYVSQAAAVTRSPLVHDTRLFLSVGEHEVDGPVDFYRDLAANALRFGKELEASANPRLDHRLLTYPGQTHASVAVPALSDALLYLYGDGTWEPGSGYPPIGGDD